LGVIFSSSPGLIVIHDLSKGEFIRKIIITDAAMDKTDTKLNLNLLAVESRFSGNFVVYSQTTNMLYLYSVNGRFVVSVIVNYPISSMEVMPNGKYLITVAENDVVIRNIHKYL